MTNDSACGHCHRVLGKDETRFGFEDQVVCAECLTQLAEQGNICPACHKMLKSEDEEVGLVLVPEGSTSGPMGEPVVMMIVCPHCRVMFFDRFQYGVLKAFKNGTFKFGKK